MKKLLKLSKTAKILLFAGIFVVITGSLGMTYSQQMQQQKQLDGELDIAEMRVSKLQLNDLQQRGEELQIRLDKETATLAAAKDNMRQPVASIDVVDECYAIADDCDILITAISSSSVKEGDMEGIACSMMTIGATVSGRLSDMLDFVTRLNNDLTTGIVNSTQLSISETDEGSGTTKASLKLNVYSYEGD